MGTEPARETDEVASRESEPSVEREAGSTAAERPDWGQFLLVSLAVLALTLAALTVPALGGVAGTPGDGDGDILPAELAELGDVGEAGGDDAGGDGGSEANEGSDEVDPDTDTDTDTDTDADGDAEGDSEIDTDPNADDEGEGEQEPEQGQEQDDAADIGADPDDGEVDGDYDADGEQSDESGESEAESDDATAEESDADSEIEAGDDTELEQDEDGKHEQDETDDDHTETDSGYDIAFNESPTPGSVVEVTVTENDETRENAGVAFNGELIGETDADGTVTGTVPFTDTLTVAVDPADTAAESTTEPSIRGPVGGPAGAPVHFYGGSRVVPVSDHDETDADSDDETEGEDETAERDPGTERTVEMDAETELSIDREAPMEHEDALVAGTNATVTATVAENPIPDGTVLIDDQEVGTTDASGATQVTIPETTGEMSIAVERDDIRAERELAVYGLAVDVAERIPLPGRTVTADVSYVGPPVENETSEDSETNDSTRETPESVANATVFLDGTAVGETGADGTSSVALPLANEASLGAQVGESTAVTTVSGLYRNAALVVLGVLVFVTALGWHLVRRFGLSREIVRSVPSLIRRAVRRAGTLAQLIGRKGVEAVVRLARGLEQAGSWLVERGRDALAAAWRAGRWLLALRGQLAERGLAALAAIHPARLVRALLALLRSLGKSSRERAASMTGSAQTDTAAAESTADADQSVRTLRTLWDEFVRAVRPPRIRTKTPGEIGRYAVDRGFPEPPVRTVVNAFRDAEYGESPPTETQLESVERAVGSVTEPEEESKSDEQSTRNAKTPGSDNEISRNDTAVDEDLLPGRRTDSTTEDHMTSEDDTRQSDEPSPADKPTSTDESALTGTEDRNE
ncbi:hypothetical protein C482_05461 [Natrialba chahannaoensis JCM 10990]|uniref:Protein-glutamine gamma-glutamyltransferase-like C-terminal domain-containing protein n=1 Tax=Natrialba chahannaoensis JCM 10990 TaxID=1227492 RepID=M0AW87_9EURY|nr:DUF4129 domain-containing protein [Natrialba chahannaoensis]ELZ02233.1 hypothetical protein C482_05461 [Natrialba chahannaoensis JCM 10990]